MSNINLLYKNIIFSLLFASALVVGAIYVSADDIGHDIDIDYPIAELGNCTSEDECIEYCDSPDHMMACIDFGEEQGLMSHEEAEHARRFGELNIRRGPGGCDLESECEMYCESTDHMQECIMFAREHGLMDPEELEEAEMVLQALEGGAQLPGGCTSKESCDAYCDLEENIMECIAFAEAAGFISPKEAEMVRKTGGKGPGGCVRDECEVYCENPDNMEACIMFAIEYDLMPPDELEEMRMMLRAIQAGITPPACGGREECDVYCSQVEHMTECMEFALAAGFIDEEDAEQVRKMLEFGITTGPGGCTGEEECQAFCENPDNMGECIDFAVLIGDMTEEEAEQIKQMIEEGGMIGGRFEGPGGCQSEEECKAYCENPDNTRECIEHSVRSGFMSPEEAEEMLRIMESGELEKMMRDDRDDFNKDQYRSFDGGAEFRIEERYEFFNGEHQEDIRYKSFSDDERYKEVRDEFIQESIITDDICKQFELAPSCDFVPEGFRDLCEQCR